ncbi:hypothetical protein ACQFX9_26385 [Aliinostoc sp. HNIBRCY26]|uniref:hypothetical protein n=1 Tax=Aliinostoc sp. HNIBRCY26 TaxID=3418997 RepID=UPI003D00973E
MTSYSNEIERSEKLVYFLSLAGIYRDFWCLAADECFEFEYKHLADDLRMGIEAFNEEQLREYIYLIQEEIYAGVDIHILNKQQLLDYINLIHKYTYSIKNTYNFCNSELQKLANQGRQFVYSALLQSFDNDVNEFFLSLYCTAQKISDSDLSDKNYDEYDDIEDNYSLIEDNYSLDDIYKTDSYYNINTTPPSEHESVLCWIRNGCQQL